MDELALDKLSREHGLAQLPHHLTVLEYLAIAVSTSVQYHSWLFPLPAEASGDVSVVKESLQDLPPSCSSFHTLFPWSGAPSFCSVSSRDPFGYIYLETDALNTHGCLLCSPWVIPTSSQCPAWIQRHGLQQIQDDILHSDNNQ